MTGLVRQAEGLAPELHHGAQPELRHRIHRRVRIRCSAALDPFRVDLDDEARRGGVACTGQGDAPRVSRVVCACLPRRVIAARPHGEGQTDL